MGVNFCNNVTEIKYYFNISGIKKKKEGGSEKGEVKIHPFHLPWIHACIIQMIIVTHHSVENTKDT